MASDDDGFNTPADKVMESLLAAFGVLIGRPLLILLVAAMWALAALGLPRSRRALTANSLAWITFAGWEALVLALTPEANIRVDLLLIAPLLSGLGLWGLVAIL